MKNIRYLTRQYIDWVIKLGKFRFSLLGFIVLAILALCTHITLSFLFMGEVHWESVTYSITFGLISAPFVIYFFTLLVEKLELSRLKLSDTVSQLRLEIQERILAERRLEQASKDKTALMATISHELRTPLNGIVGLSRMLLETTLTKEQSDYLNTINFSALSLGYIFNDIIDLEKIDSTRISLYEQETDFHKFITNIENIGRFMAQQKKLDFHLNRAENLPRFLMLDETRLSQVLWNLLSNAVKFTQKGEIIINIEQLSENQYQFTVTDTGQGIPAEELQHIFTLYYQVEENQHKSAGSGIGLAVSKNIAQLMQGDLTVTSQIGKGSVFTLTIKAEPVTPKESVENSQSIAADLKVLLVEDIELNVVVARAMLENLGFSVNVAMNGKQAIELFEKNEYDLLLLDIQLPDMTGFSIAQYLRQNYENGIYDYLPPLIALTAGVIQSTDEYQAKGMDDVLHKPLDSKELKQCLLTYFGDDVYSEPKKQKSAVDFHAEFETETQNIIDYDFVRELVELIGVENYLSNLKLFSSEIQNDELNLCQSYKTYLSDPNLITNFTTMAHKVKGAAGSLGLKKIQELAHLIQQSDIPNWKLHLRQWIDDITEIIPTSLNLLQDWLEAYQQNSIRK